MEKQQVLSGQWGRMEGGQDASIRVPVLSLTGSVPLNQKFSHCLALASPRGKASYHTDGWVPPPPHPCRVSDPVGVGWGGEYTFLTDSQVVMWVLAGWGPKAFQNFFKRVKTLPDSCNMN